jgi:hypothetical protein
LNHNLPGAGFKNQIGASIGRDQYLRLPNESPAFNQSLPGSHLPLPTKSGNASVAATGHGAVIDLGTAVAEGQGGVVNGEATITGHQADADLGTLVARGAGAPAVTGHALSIDAGTPGLAGAANTVQTGHAIAADVGTAVMAGAAVYSANGDQLAADVGTPTIGGAGVAAPGGDVGQADVGTVVATGITAFNGTATPDGVASDIDVGTAIAESAAVVSTVVRPRVHRRPVVWEWPVVKEKSPEVLPIVKNGEASPIGATATASIGAVRVNGTAKIITGVYFGRSMVGSVIAVADNTLMDQMEEEFIQLLIAA